MHLFKIKKAFNYAIGGAIIALIAISLLIFSVNIPDPAWGKNWYIKPLIVSPLVASIGSVFLYIINLKKTSSKFLNFLLFLLSLIVFVFFLWIGIILGLDGTLWN